MMDYDFNATTDIAGNPWTVSSLQGVSFEVRAMMDDVRRRANLSRDESQAELCRGNPNETVMTAIHDEMTPEEKASLITLSAVFRTASFAAPLSS